MSRVACGILIVLGAGHLTLLALTSGASVVGWAERGLWAAVPLVLGDAGEQSTDALVNEVTFWAGPGSFAVPQVLLGFLIWHLADRGAPVPAWLCWGLILWSALAGVLLVPSPFLLGAVAGILLLVVRRGAVDARPNR
jgi:hypothetical protein